MPSEPNRPRNNQDHGRTFKAPNSQPNQVPGAQPQPVRTIEDDVPKGVVWSPSEEDHKPLRKPKALEIPSFIPERLDQPVGAQQTALSRSMRPEQNIQDTEGRPMQAPAQTPDFDPAVDDPNDVFVGNAGLQTPPPVFQDAVGRQVDPRQAHVKQPTVSGQDSEHPVLQRLRDRFGLKSIPVKSETIGGIKFTFRKYTNQAYSKFVINQVQSQSVETDAEFMAKLPYALAAISIAAIDDVPVHEVFASELDLDPVLELPGAVKNPMNPPTSVVVKIAEVLYPWLVGLAVPELADTLANVLGTLFPAENLVQDKGLWRYVCPKHGCGEQLDRLPRYTVDGVMRPVYCSTHGVPMRALGSLVELADIPLA